MKQVLYISDSLVGSDVRELDRIMVQSRTNNALSRITGLLWTDGVRFAQVLEGDAAGIDELLTRLSTDRRHARLRIVKDSTVGERRYGDWAMLRGETDTHAHLFEQRMIRHLDEMTDALSQAFRQIIARSHKTNLG